MEFFLVAGPNVSLEKLLLPVISTGLSLEDTGLFLDRSGRNLIWEFCLPSVPEPQRSVVRPFWRPALNYTIVSSGDLMWIIQAAHCPLRSRYFIGWDQGGLWHSENPRFLFGLFLPVHSARSSSSALGASGEASGLSTTVV